jgi:tartrate dehydratase beta subunit/fumarate hydratase class I family protein
MKGLAGTPVRASPNLQHDHGERVIDFADLGFEAVRRIEVRDLPAFIVIDEKGNSLHERAGRLRTRQLTERLSIESPQ